MISPLDSTSLISLTIWTVGALQANELMIANNGATRLYSGEAGTHINGDITAVDNLTNTNLQDQLNLKAPLHNPTFSGTVVRLSKGMVDLANADNTSDLANPISTATQNALDLKAPLHDPTSSGRVGLSKAIGNLSY